MCACACVCECVWCICHIHEGGQKVSWNWSCKESWALWFGCWEINLGLFAGAFKSFNHRVTSLAQLFKKHSVLSAVFFILAFIFSFTYLLLSRGVCYSIHVEAPTEDNLLRWFSPSTSRPWGMNSGYQAWWHARSNLHQGVQKIHECGHGLRKTLVCLRAKTHMVAHKHL